MVCLQKKLLGNLMLLLTAMIWGTAFVAQSVGMDFIGPFTFNGVRSIIGGVALLPVVLVFGKRGSGERKAQTKRHTWIGGLWCGVVLFLASSFQQMGIQYTTVGKASFITTLYIVLVPLLGLFWGRRPRPVVWLAVALAAAGLYLLCMRGDFSINRGDLLVICCALLYTGHILVIDHFSPRADPVAMSCIQFFVCGFLGLVSMFLFETPDAKAILACWGPILYAGVLSSGVAYTLQIVAQKHTDATVASLLMSLESVFGALAGWLILGESFTGREMMGVALMFGAVVLAQLPGRRA